MCVIHFLLINLINICIFIYIEYLMKILSLLLRFRSQFVIYRHLEKEMVLLNFPRQRLLVPLLSMMCSLVIIYDNYQ